MIKLSSIFTHKSKLSKFETALLKAFRVNDIEDVPANGVVVLKRIPDVITIAAGDNSSLSVTLGSGAASSLEADRIVKVVNKDADPVTVLGVVCALDSTTELRFDGSSFAEL